MGYRSDGLSSGNVQSGKSYRRKRSLQRFRNEILLQRNAPYGEGLLHILLSDTVVQYQEGF